MPAEIPVSRSFLSTRKGNVLSQRIEITKLATDCDLEIVLDDQRFEGYRIDGMTFIITNKEDAAVAEKILNKIKSNINNIQYSTYNEYYIHYINYLLHIYHNTTQYSTLIPITMTQSFYADHKENQPVDTQVTTTVDDHLEKKPLTEYGIRQLNFRSNYQHLHRVL